jgi:hypothetical protein
VLDGLVNFFHQSLHLSKVETDAPFISLFTEVPPHRGEADGDEIQD